MKRLLQLAFGLSLLHVVAFAQNTTPGQPFAVLHPADYRHYVDQFAADEREAIAQQPEDEWPWMESNIPLFDSSNKQFEEMYYFRWYAWQKHLVSTPRGYIITE